MDTVFVDQQGNVQMISDPFVWSFTSTGVNTISPVFTKTIFPFFPKDVDGIVTLSNNKMYAFNKFYVLIFDSPNTQPSFKLNTDMGLTTENIDAVVLYPTNNKIYVFQVREKTLNAQKMAASERKKAHVNFSFGNCFSFQTAKYITLQTKTVLETQKIWFLFHCWIRATIIWAIYGFRPTIIWTINVQTMISL